MIGYTSYQYIVHDTMCAGLSMASNFEAAGVAVTIDGDDFFDFVTEVNGQSFTVTFGSSFINEKAGDAIIITYSATLNSGALINAANTNSAYLEYSNDPYFDSEFAEEGDTGTTETPPTTADVYTFDLNIFKYAGDLEGEFTALAKAKFELYKADTTDPADLGDKVYFASNGIHTTTLAAEYTVATSGTSQIESPVSGKLRLIGLDAGTYYLVETAPPEGFNILPAPVKIVIEHELSSGDGTGITKISFAQGTNQLQETSVVNVQNNAGGLLPGTGGVGTVIFVLIGIALLAGIVTAFAVLRRKVILQGVK